MSMLFYRLDHRVATLIRILGLALVSWTVFTGKHPPGAGGRDLVITLLFAAAAIAWIAWTIRPMNDAPIAPELYVMAAAGGFLTGAAPGSAASVFVFVAVVSAGVRAELAEAAPIAVVGVLAVAASALIYGASGLGVLAYSLGFAAALLAGSNSRQSIARADQAELLLAQTQRSHEEQLRSARLEESTRIAREIHDVLAHTLAGLTIQLEATSSLVEHGAARDTVLARLHRAHELAREGLRETRRAVGALRSDTGSVEAAAETPAADPAHAIAALVADYRSAAEAPAQLTIDGESGRLAGDTGQAVVRVVQEALTNVLKHAPGAHVHVAIHAGEDPDDDLVVVVDDHLNGAPPAPAPSSVAATGGGYGLRGMHERAESLGGTLSAGADGDGWHVELRLPARAAESNQPDGAAA